MLGLDPILEDLILNVICDRDVYVEGYPQIQMWIINVVKNPTISLLAFFDKQSLPTLR